MNNYINLLTPVITLKRRCAEPSCFSGFADLTDGSIPVCGMIVKWEKRCKINVSSIFL